MMKQLHEQRKQAADWRMGAFTRVASRMNAL
jgi:hypothetical protein